MKEPLLKDIRCPKCKKRLKLIEQFPTFHEIEGTTLVCDKGHAWSVENGIPRLVYPSISEEDVKWIREYGEMAENYDELVKQYDEWLGADLMKEREAFTQFITIEGPARIIDVSIGTAANFEALYNRFKGKQMGRFDLHGLDVSTGMLMASKKKMQSLDIDVSLIHGSVFNIPYKKNTFDIVIHSGGINTFSDIPKALEEMLRITKPWGFVIVTDEGLSPEVRETERGKAIIEANSLFAAKPPLEHVPDKARDLTVEWVVNGTFYQMMFRK
ncbi:MAG: class I SAM-dependent methyltransferase [Candidatus Thorarchaeota archaeon]